MDKPDGATWLTNMAPAVFVVAAGMIATGAYLIDPAIADLGFALRAERTAFVGAFLTFAGIVLALSVVPQALETGNTMVDLALQLVLGKLALIVLAFIELAVGAQALFADPRNDWAALLLIPGLLSLAIWLTSDTKEEAPSDADDETATSDSGKIDVAASARFSALYGLFYALGMGAVMIWLACATWAYYRLSGAILSGETLDLATAGQSLSATLQSSWPLVLALSIVCAVIVAGAGLAPSLAGWFTNAGTPEANRDLTKDEIAFINAAAAQTRAYAQSQGYDRNTWVVNAIGIAGLVVVAGAGGFVAFSGIAMLAAAPGPSFPIEQRPGGASMLVFFLSSILLGILPTLILSRVSRRYGERSGWVGIGEKNEYFSLEGRLTALVRARRLSPTATFHPGDFLQSASQSLARYFYIPAAALTVVGLFFLHRDLNAVDQLTADEIEIADYWTLTRHRFAYTDVEHVIVRCFLTNKGESVETYELHLPGGRSIDLYRNAGSFEAQIEAYEAVDAKLTAASIPFVPGAHKGWNRGDEPGYDTACVDQVARAFPENLRERVRRFFHVDTLAAAETIWPWDPELAKAATAGDHYRVDEALALYTKAIDGGRLTPHMLAVAHAGRARARENYELAYGLRDEQMLLVLRDYRKARELKPTLDAYRDEAWANIALGAYDEAEAVYRQALTLDRPKPHWSLLGLARVDRIRGRYDAAMKHLDEVLKVWGEDNASMSIFYHRARVLFLKGDDPGVVDAITKGLSYQTNFADAFRYRACARARLGAFAQATEDMDQTIKLATGRPNSEAWAKTPSATAYHADHARDLAAIKAMAAGAEVEANREKLCKDSWNYGEDPRPRSPLLPPR